MPPQFQPKSRAGSLSELHSLGWLSAGKAIISAASMMFPSMQYNMSVRAAVKAWCEHVYANDVFKCSFWLESRKRKACTRSRWRYPEMVYLSLSLSLVSVRGNVCWRNPICPSSWPCLQWAPMQEGSLALLQPACQSTNWLRMFWRPSFSFSSQSTTSARSHRNRMPRSPRSVQLVT